MSDTPEREPMEVEEEPPLSSCPICRRKAAALLEIDCCDKCHQALTMCHELDPDDPENQRVEAFSPSPMLEDASLAIATESPQLAEGGCSARSKRKATKKYYKSLNSWRDMITELDEVVNNELIPEDKHAASKKIRCATYISFTINLCLLVAKAFALYSSASYTIISSLCDSALDIIAGIIIACTAANSKFTREDMGKYPVGKSRVSTVGVLVFSVLMACCAAYIIIQCIMALVQKEPPSESSQVSIIIMGVTIGLKFIMCIVYYSFRHPITSALAADHRNDVLTNALGLFMYYGGRRWAWWMDSVGGILLSLFVLVNWGMNAAENAKMLLGSTAPPEVIRALTYIAIHHHPLIIAVEQVIAFQVGPQYFAELHIVIPGHIPLEVAHWIGESLQLKVERVPDIERAWVHVDTESHNENEHMLFMRATGKLENNRSFAKPESRAATPEEEESVPVP